MSHSLTAVTPTTPAQVAVNLAPPVPDASDFRTAESLYGAFQSLLNLASIAAAFVTGGTIGDGTGSGVTLDNAFSTSAGKDINGGHDINAANNVTAANDVLAQTVVASGNLAGTNLILSGQASIGDDVACATTLHVAGASTLHDTACTTLAVSSGMGTNGPLSFTGAGRIIHRTVVGAASGGGTLDVTAADCYWFAAGMSSQSYALGTSGVANGDEICAALELQGGAAALTITGGAHGSLVLTNNGSGSIFSATWRRIAGAWQCVDVGTVP